jgi:PPOX class probable F420-dependent enzyme
MPPDGPLAAARPLSADACRLLDGGNYAHLATLMPDGSPKVDPVWVGRDGDLVLVTTDAKSIKARNAEADPRVSLSITSIENPYEQLLVRGTVIEVRDDNDLTVLDALSERYIGAPFPRRRWSTRVVLVVAPTLARYYLSSLHDPRFD